MLGWSESSYCSVDSLEASGNLNLPYVFGNQSLSAASQMKLLTILIKIYLQLYDIVFEVKDLNLLFQDCFVLLSEHILSSNVFQLPNFLMHVRILFVNCILLLCLPFTLLLGLVINEKPLSHILLDFLTIFGLCLLQFPILLK